MPFSHNLGFPEYATQSYNIRMDAANSGFLARQLMLTDLRGKAEETPGGCLFLDDVLWAGIWDVAAIDDAEEYILNTQRTAKERGVSWGGVVLLLKPGDEASETVTELEEALFIYGYEPRSGVADGGPEMVQILSKQVKFNPPTQLEITVADQHEEAVQTLLVEAGNEQDALTPPWMRGDVLHAENNTMLIAHLDGKPVGLLLTHESELVSRIVMLYVTPDARDNGIGAALAARSAELAQAAGLVVCSAWTYRTGKLRYFFGKAGYAEQLSAKYFEAE